MKKLLSILLAALMLLSSVTVVMADGTTEYELYDLADKTAYGLAGTNGFPDATGLEKYAFTGGTFYLPNPPSAGMVGYGALSLRKPNADNSSAYDPVTFAEVIDGDNLYDYELQLTVTKPCKSPIAADLEIGIGNYKAGSQKAQNFSSVPSVVKTVYLGNIISSIPQNENKTITIDIADILDNGNEQKFVYDGEEPNELTAENANLVAFKATSDTAGTTRNFLKIISVKLVKKSEDAVPNIPTVVDFKGTSGIAFPASETPLPETTSPNFNVASGGIFSSKNANVGDTIYGYMGARISAKTASFLVNSLFGDAKMEDYVMEVEFVKKTKYAYVENIEIGLACNNGYESYTKLPVSIKTVDANFDETYKALASGDTAKVSVPVKDILTKGDLHNISYTGRINPTFAPENIVGIAVKADAARATTTAQYVLGVNSIKFVRKTADITIDEENAEISFSACDYSDAPALAGTQAIVAYYNDLDEDGVYTLDYCDVEALVAADANNAALTLPFDSNYGGAKMIKAFLFDSMNDITPITKAEVLIRE